MLLNDLVISLHHNPGVVGSSPIAAILILKDLGIVSLTKLKVFHKNFTLIHNKLQKQMYKIT